MERHSGQNSCLYNRIDVFIHDIDVSITDVHVPIIDVDVSISSIDVDVGCCDIRLLSLSLMSMFPSSDNQYRVPRTVHARARA